MKKVSEPVTKSLENTSQDITKTLMETPNNNNKALENSNNKHLRIMNDRGILASYVMSPLSKMTNPENASQFKLVKDHNSNRVNGFSIKNTIPIILQGNMLTFRDTSKVFKIEGDLLKMITNKNYNVDIASFSDNKLMYDFAKEMNFDIKAQGRRSTRDSTLINILKSPGLKFFVSGVSNTIF